MLYWAVWDYFRKVDKAKPVALTEFCGCYYNHKIFMVNDVVLSRFVTDVNKKPVLLLCGNFLNPRIDKAVELLESVNCDKIYVPQDLLGMKYNHDFQKNGIFKALESRLNESSDVEGTELGEEYINAINACLSELRMRIYPE